VIVRTWHVLIRAEEVSDHDAVYAVNASAFESPAEAVLVDTLREHAQPIVSLVAELNGQVVGHIMFSPVLLSGNPDLRMMGLGPMAVAPDHQRSGVGSALVRAGVEECRQLGFGAIIVLGHPEFYPRFGFTPSSRFAIDSQYEVPEEVFMAMELQPGALSGRTGRVNYHPAFNNL